MFAVLRNKVLFFVRTVIMVAVFYKPAAHIIESVCFFEAITIGHLCLSPLRSVSVLDT